jgi:adhesin/invasin
MNGGNNQTAAATTAVSVAPSVKILDAFGNAVSGVQVTFAVASGGGTVTGATATTDASGVAKVGGWTLGPIAGGNTLTAVATGLTGSPVTFAATASGGATTIAANAGNNQSAAAGSPVTVAPSVKVTDAGGNPVAGVSVTFLVASGGGSITGPSATTDASGLAAVGSWTLGSTAGGNVLTASVPGLSGSPVTFVATGTAGPAVAIAVNAGNNQTGTAGGAVSVPPSVKVTDAHGNPVAGVAVTFAVATGGGSVTGAAQTTNASGVATVGSWMLGASAGTNTLTASAAGLSGSPVTFTATGSVDTTAPTIVSLSIAPTTVDVTSSSQTLVIAVHATDAGSGVVSMSVTLTSPDGTRQIFLACGLSSGTSADGTLSCSATIPQGSMAGDWSVTSVEVDDAAGNARTMSQAQLTAAGFPSKFTVVGH